MQKAEKIYAFFTIKDFFFNFSKVNTRYLILEMISSISNSCLYFNCTKFCLFKRSTEGLIRTYF